MATRRITCGFEAAHWLPRVPDGHKCRRLHGHSYRATVAVREAEGGPSASTNPDTSQHREENKQMEHVVDIEDIVRRCVGELDHRCLNEIDGLDNPTAERIAQWLWQRLWRRLEACADLVEIRVDETCESACIYRRGR